MKRLLIKALVLTAGIIMGLLLFFPWNNASETLLSVASRVMADNGIFVTVKDSEVSGVFSKNFTYRGINADFPVFRITLREATLTPSIISSLFSGKRSCHITVGRGSLVPVTRQPLEWNSGEAELTLTQEGLLLEDISFTGKTSITGFMEISRVTMKIARAKLLLKVQPELDRVLEMISRTGMLPLSKIKNGEWRIER